MDAEFQQVFDGIRVTWLAVADFDHRLSSQTVACRLNGTNLMPEQAPNPPSPQYWGVGGGGTSNAQTPPELAATALGRSPDL